MFQFIAVSIAFLIGLGAFFSLANRQEIIANWDKYRANPVFLFSAFLYKPDNDTRSRFQFTADNFKEVIESLVLGLFEIVMTPLFQLLRSVAKTMEKNLQSIMSMRQVFGNMWRGFMDMSAIFENRFVMLLHQLRVIMFRIFTAFQRVTGVATSAVFSGLSAIYSALNMIDLIIKVVIIILLILVLLVIFFFFILAPSIPVILIVVGIISTTAMAGAVGGMASTFCFGELTLIQTQRGSVPISDIQIGDVLQDGSNVTGTMQFVGHSHMYKLNNIIVSGSHIVFLQNGNPIFVKNHPDAISTQYDGTYIYCLNTSTHKIIIGNTVFSDWEELGNETLVTWNQFVFDTLNGKNTWNSESISPYALQSEAGIIPSSLVQTPTGCLCLEAIRPGMMVLDADGIPTCVTGCVRIANTEVIAISKDGISAGSWIRLPGSDIWKQPTDSFPGVPQTHLLSLTTEAGSYLLSSNVGIRDYTDVGWNAIASSYEWVLKSL